MATNEQINSNSLEEFKRYVFAQKTMRQKQYEQLLALDLSRQQSSGCFQRNILIVLTSSYDDALKNLQTLKFKTDNVEIKQGLSDLTKPALSAFDGYADEFLLFVVNKHRTSCALSNFPDEHKPDKLYINAVMHEIAELWRDFAINVNNFFISE